MTKPPRRGPAGHAAEAAPETRAGMQLVSRIAAVLRALEGQSAGLSLGQIAGATGLPRPTVQRLVDALLVEGLAMADPLQGGVRLGPLIARLATSVRTDLVVLARPHLERLCGTTRETVAMTVLQDGKVVVLAFLPPSGQEIRLMASVGAIWTLHSTADGKALLAGLPEATQRALLTPPLVQKTPSTVTDPDTLLAQLHEVERTGFAVDLGGTTPGISAIATRIEDASGTRYAVSILTGAAQFPALREGLQEALGACRKGILAAAGLRPGGGPR